MKYITIGNVKIKKTAALAPMAGIADTAFRLMAKSYGCAYVCGEMVSAKGLVYTDRKSAELLTVTREERPMAIQLFGNEPDFIEKAAKIAAGYEPDIIDINCGCPVPKVVNNGSGSALMKNPKLIGELVKAVKNATDIPATVKIRKGWDDESVNAAEAAFIAEKAGAAAVAVHGRTKEQLYSGKADWEIIKLVKQTVSIPVIGNGDVVDGKSCKAMYEQTGCDLVMVGRGAYGKPWIFEEIEAYLNDGIVLPQKSLDERLDIMTKHIKAIIREKGEFIGMKEARKHAVWYLHGIPNAARLRNLCGTLSTYQDLLKLIEQIRSGKEYCYEK